MKKKYTVMIFDESRLGEVKTRKFSGRVVAGVLAFSAVFVAVSCVGFYKLSQLHKEKAVLLTYKSENEKLKNQIAGYENQMVVINDKLASVVELEEKVRGLASFGGKALGEKKQLAMGGKELDPVTDITKANEQKDKDYFKDLSNTLSSLGSDLEKRAMSLTELADMLEKQKLVLSSTPSIWPTSGWISSRFGYRISPFTGRRVFHEGLDIAAKYGAPVRAAAKGTVIFSGRKNGYGKIVIIDHGFGYMTKYAHNSNILVHAGQKVSKGDRIAQVGNTGRSTGPHVHYEVLVNGVPVNPARFILGAK
ncbi:peptidoglycan DD-metalloendopeptidase family protein [Seleniivibrio sp.]|uniref:peptidoglycan DD-metalloendopeptidase family protein n=1 Tax=Seleniivibrio sp. TaxID=2898801 RepID=UPI0025E8F519|nr:peptidoglycan DD-metalloendopeptidase family protein [Seleniivibrio sp.]